MWHKASEPPPDRIKVLLRTNKGQVWIGHYSKYQKQYHTGFNLRLSEIEIVYWMHLEDLPPIPE